ncbi:hypothetical protein GDO81_027413 [Engystomops pustulosus]|uniref:Uncharacterized protein n=1 Tax=Engystomops pustulosus TaxID=76066 RepID=A0AAV6YFG3_ENGPU|nr:hypothetical protein GDO81_027413 [Engystomops pustulosus]
MSVCPVCGRRPVLVCLVCGQCQCLVPGLWAECSRIQGGSRAGVVSASCEDLLMLTTCLL